MHVTVLWRGLEGPVQQDTRVLRTGVERLLSNAERRAAHQLPCHSIRPAKLERRLEAVKCLEPSFLGNERDAELNVCVSKERLLRHCTRKDALCTLCISTFEQCIALLKWV